MNIRKNGLAIERAQRQSKGTISRGKNISSLILFFKKTTQNAIYAY